VLKKEKVEKKEPAPEKLAVTAKEESTAAEPREAKKAASNTPSKAPSTQGSRAASVNGDEAAPNAESRDADAVVKEQEEELDESLVQDMYGKEHVNVVFIGHVDAGKSTLGGNILYLTGMVDERTMEKYEKEAKEAGRESWYLSWALDSTKEERSKGKTVEVGRARFETEKRRYTILDAPGHKSYVPNMISGAAQADVGVLVISARKGEYETGFDKGGQTREHAVLAKMQGINKLVIVINKMDDPTVEWSKDRYNFCPY
jgi:peptide chain release factor subunit 3